MLSQISSETGVRDANSIKIDLNEIKNNITERYNVTFESTPRKSEDDKNEYLQMKLCNGLTALLISDVENLIDPLEVVFDEDSSTSEDLLTEKSSTISLQDSSDDTMKTVEIFNKNKTLAYCALTVGAGSFNDPETIPGLAHFVEHMVFIGSEKYPEDNDLDSYVITRGGSTNAYTDCETTTFHFSCPNKNLYNALDRFSSYLISPLMKNSYIKKVTDSLQREFESNCFSDTFRKDQLLHSTAQVDNPVHKFMWGNLITLKQNVTEDVLYESAKDFWKNHYSPHKMTLTIQAKWPLDTLGLWVAQYFGEIPQNNVTSVTLPQLDQPFKMELFHKIYIVMPVKIKNYLHLSWALPTVMHLYQSKPLSYLSFVIQHKGEGSLFSNLQNKYWVLDIQTKSGNDRCENNSIFSLFSIDIELTDEGVKYVEQIIETVFSYIKLLKHKEFPESIVKECQTINEIKFRYQHEAEDSEYVERLSQNMQIYPSAEYMSGDILLYEYKSDEIKKILELLTPERINIMILSKTAADKLTLDQTEPWFNTKYTMQDIAQESLIKWRNCKIDPKLSLPKPNIYLPSNFTIIPKPKSSPEYPTSIMKNEFLEVWYKADCLTQLPHGYIKIYLISPIAKSLPQNSVMCDLFIAVIDFLIIKETYAGSLAGMSSSVSQGDNGLELTVIGFNDKMFLLLKTILQQMITIAKCKNVTEDMFEAIKDQEKKEYYNTTLDSTKLIDELRLAILCTNFWDSLKKFEVINEITIDKFLEYSSNFFEHLYIKCLFQGNISKQNTIDIAHEIVKLIFYKPLLTGTYPNTRTHVIPLGEKVIRLRTNEVQNTICVVTNYYQSGLNNIADNIKVELLMLLMYEPLYESLKNEEKLASHVSCDASNIQGVLGFTVTVKFQADKFTAEYVEGRITNFLKNFKMDLEDMTSDSFKQIKEVLTTLKQKYVQNLKDEFRRNWAEIVTDEYMFNRMKREISSIERTKLSDLIQFLSKTLGNIDDKEFVDCIKCSRKLSIQVESETDSKNENNNNNKIKEIFRESQANNLGTFLKVIEMKDKNFKHKFIKDIEKFKSSMFIFPYYNYNVIPDM